MGINPISSVRANMTSAVNAIHFCENNLSEELIRKLIKLGIDPSKVQSNAEAQKLIAQAEKEQNTQNVPAQICQPQDKSSSVDIKQLNDDIKKFGDKFGIDVKTIGSLKDIVDRFDIVVKEFTMSAAAQKNRISDAKIDGAQDKTAVKLSTGKEVVEKPETVQADFKSIKDRVDKIEQEKNSMYAGQNMLAMMNRMALGI